MKHDQIAIRIVAGVLPAMALFATPGLAQDVAQPALPAAQAPVPAAGAPAGPSAADRAKYEASIDAATGTAAAPVEVPAAAPAARPVARRVVPRATALAAPVAQPEPIAPAAPVESAPTEFAPAPPLAAAGVQPSGTIPPPAGPAPTTTIAEPTTRESSTIGGLPLWVWVVGALAVLALVVGGLFLRRRRDDEVWTDGAVAPDEAHTLAAGAPVVAPVAQQVEVVEPETIEVAAITAGAAPVVAGVDRTVAAAGPGRRDR